MATGTITKLSSQGVPGDILIEDDQAGGARNGTHISFTEIVPNVVVGSAVTFLILDDGLGTVYAYNIQFVDPFPPPPDEGDVKNGVTLASLTITGAQVVTLKGGATITGDVKMEGGKLIMKENSKIMGSLDARNNSEIFIHTSSVNGDMTVKDSAKSVILVKGSVGGDVMYRSVSTVTVVKGSVGGDTHYRQNGTISIDGLVVTNRDLTVKDNTVNTTVTNCLVQKGDLLIKDNVGCNHKGNTAPLGSVNITSCTLIP